MSQLIHRPDIVGKSYSEYMTKATLSPLLVTTATIFNVTNLYRVLLNTSLWDDADYVIAVIEL